MEALLIPFGIFLAAGLFLILAEALKIPTVMTMRAMSSAGKRRRKRAGAWRCSSWTEQCWQGATFP